MTLAIPALLLGSLFGRLWCSFYRLDGPRKQPGRTLLGFVVILFLTFFSCALMRMLIADFAPDTILWKGARAMIFPLYIPTIPLISYLTSLMYRRRLESRFRIQQARLAQNRVQYKPLDIRDTPSDRGASTLG